MVRFALLAPVRAALTTTFHVTVGLTPSVRQRDTQLFAQVVYVRLNLRSLAQAHIRQTQRSLATGVNCLLKALKSLVHVGCGGNRLDSRLQPHSSDPN